MSETPQFAQYPRSQDSEAANQLEAAYKAYKAAGMAFLLLIVSGLGTSLLFGFAAAVTKLPELFYLFYILVPIIAFFLLGEAFRQLQIAKGWEDSKRLVLQILYAILCGLCCGIFGYLFLQNIAIKAMQKHGVKVGLLGVNKAEYEQRLRVLRGN